MIAISLQSGSCGNCIYVEAGPVRLLFDAGISFKLAGRRLREHGRDIRDVQAVIISHNHSDHVCGTGVFQRMLGVPVYLTPATHAAVESYLGEMGEVRYFTAGDQFRFDGVSISTIPTPHDGVDGAAFVVGHEGKRLGILTDLGHPFALLKETLAGLDAAFLESNYDPQMLDICNRPEHVKARIRGEHGHISNYESAELLEEWTCERLKWACLAHLSGENNNPSLALSTHRKIVRPGLTLYVAPRHATSAMLEV